MVRVAMLSKWHVHAGGYAGMVKGSGKAEIVAVWDDDVPRGEAWAKELGATEIYTGVSEADYSGYPDCREAFIRAQQRMLRLALEWPVKIVTPFMHLSKAAEWALADRLGILDVIENETLTC